MFLNEDYFDDIDVTDDDIRKHTNDNILLSDDFNTYQYYINVYTIDKHINRKISYIIRNIPCISDCSVPKYYTYSRDIEYSDENEISDDVFILYGINADFNYRDFMLLLKSIFRRLKDIVISLGFYTHPEIKHYEFNNISDFIKNPSISDTERIAEVLDLFNIKYDWNTLLSEINISMHSLFCDYINLGKGYKHNFIFAGEVNPSQMTDDVLSKFNKLNATDILSWNNSSTVYWNTNLTNIENTDIRKHITDDEKNKARFYIIVMTRGNKDCHIIFYVYYTKVCKVTEGNMKLYKNIDKPVNCMIMLSLHTHINKKYIEDGFRIYDSLGFNVPELIEQTQDVIPSISGQYESVKVKQILANIKKKYLQR